MMLVFRGLQGSYLQDGLDVMLAPAGAAPQRPGGPLQQARSP